MSRNDYKTASYQNERTDYVYVVVTIGARGNKYRLISRKPRLHQNEFAYKLKIVVNPQAWEERIKEVVMSPPQPPEIPAISFESQVERSTPEQVMDRLTGKNH